MCVVAVKYIKKYGWVGAKNRDRNYSTKIKVVNSNRDGIQRLFIDDQTTRWTEGVNEFGLSIISASFSVKSDEKEGEKVLSKNKKKTPNSNKDRGFLFYTYFDILVALGQWQMRSLRRTENP